MISLTYDTWNTFPNTSFKIRVVPPLSGLHIVWFSDKPLWFHPHGLREQLKGLDQVHETKAINN